MSADPRSESELSCNPFGMGQEDGTFVALALATHL